MPTEEKSTIKTEELKETVNISPDSDQLCTAHIQSRTSKLISEHPHSAASPHGQGSPLSGVKQTWVVVMRVRPKDKLISTHFFNVGEEMG